jgi:hypothetical protein
MCSRYINESVLISAMAKWLKDVPCLTDNSAVVWALKKAGFAPRDIRDYRNAAIHAEMCRRLAFDRRFT